MAYRLICFECGTAIHDRTKSCPGCSCVTFIDASGIDTGPSTPISAPNLAPMNRVKEWREFSGSIIHHLIDYAIPQYGDMPGDDLSSWTREDCIRQIGKYVARSQTNARGSTETALDLLKIAHYACVAYMKGGPDVPSK